MFKKKRVLRWLSVTLGITLLVASSIVMMGCEGDSAESIIRQIELIIAGVYEHPTAGSFLVANNTGATISRMTIRQQGDVLEAFDNNGQQFFGTVGRATDESATITLRGPTTAGNEGVITATITVPVGSTDATMSGTWAEPTILSAVYGEATVPVNEVNTNSGGSGSSGSGLSIAGDASDINISGGSVMRVFTINGGTPPYSVVLSDESIGDLSTDSVATDGGTFTYTAISGGGGPQTINVEDSDGANASASLTQNAGS